MDHVHGSVLKRIFRDNWERFVRTSETYIRPVVFENVRRMLACCTVQLGLHVLKCEGCETGRLVPHTCKSRFCSSCGKVATDRWCGALLGLLPQSRYHHLVFTLPWQFRVLVRANRKAMQDVLCQAAMAAIRALSEHRRRLPFRPGVMLTVHTFGGDLKFNVHLHAMVTAGGLDRHGRRWVATAKRSFCPANALRKAWRREVLARVRQANKAGLLRRPRLSNGTLMNIEAVCGYTAGSCYYTNISKPIDDPEFSVRYCARYTRRPALSEARVLGYDGDTVTFRYRDHLRGNPAAVRRMPVLKFIRFLTAHIPEKHQPMTRYYGLFAYRNRSTQLVQAQALFSPRAAHPAPPESWADRRCALGQPDPTVCPQCGAVMQLRAVFGSPALFAQRLGISVEDRIPTDPMPVPRSLIPAA